MRRLAVQLLTKIFRRNPGTFRKSAPPPNALRDRGDLSR